MQKLNMPGLMQCTDICLDINSLNYILYKLKKVWMPRPFFMDRYKLISIQLYHQ